MCLCNKIVAFPEQPADILTNLVNALSAYLDDSTGKIKQLCAKGVMVRLKVFLCTS